uniref:inositol monophosphatase family protein n=1 Tax=Actinotalea sp. C106 TaxID=2908644 RepID=UPI0020279225
GRPGARRGGRVSSRPHPVLAEAADAARRAFLAAHERFDREELAATVMVGADGTPTMLIDQLVEDAVIEAAVQRRVNVLSEERGFVDVGSAVTLVADPVDGSANAAAGVPLACFSGALAVDGTFTDALTSWLHTDERWWAVRGERSRRVSGQASVAGAAVSLLRPHRRNADAWWAVSSAARRIRVLSCSTLDAVLVTTGAVDVFLDAGSDTHRLVDLAAAMVLAPAAGGVVTDVWERPLELDLDLTRRWSGVVAATPQLAAEVSALVRAHVPASSEAPARA